MFDMELDIPASQAPVSIEKAPSESNYPQWALDPYVSATPKRQSYLFDRWKNESRVNWHVTEPKVSKLKTENLPKDENLALNHVIDAWFKSQPLELDVPLDNTDTRQVIYDI